MEDSLRIRLEGKAELLEEASRRYRALFQALPLDASEACLSALRGTLQQAHSSEKSVEENESLLAAWMHRANDQDAAPVRHLLAHASEERRRLTERVNALLARRGESSCFPSLKGCLQRSLELIDRQPYREQPEVSDPDEALYMPSLTRLADELEPDVDEEPEVP